MSDPISPVWFSGDLQIARYTGSVMGGYSDIINGIKLTIKVDGDAKRIPSNLTDSFGQTHFLDYMPKPTEIDFELSKMTRRLLADQLLGTHSAFTQSSGTSQTASPTLIQDEWVPIAPGVINVSSVAITGKTAGTDFDVLPKQGLIKALNSGTAGAQTVTYNKGAVTGGKIIAGTEKAISFGILMWAENTSTGEQGLLKVPKVTVLPSKAMEFLGAKDYTTAPFKGDVIALPGQSLFEFYAGLALS